MGKSMWNFLFVILAVINLVMCIAVIAFQFIEPGPTLVFVDSQRLLSGYKGMTEARTQYQSSLNEWQGKLDTLRIEVESKIKEYELKSQTLTKQQKVALEQTITSKQALYENYRQLVSDKIKGSDQELTNHVLASVNEYIKRYGEKNEYEIIMAATPYGNIVYSKKGFDITDDILNGLNHEYGKK